MSEELPTITVDASERGDERQPLCPVLVMIWARANAERLGSVLIPTERPTIFGRGRTALRLVEQLPGRNAPSEEVDTPYLSRRQLQLALSPGGIHVKNLGKRPIYVSDRRVEEALLVPGDHLVIEGVLGFYCMLRPAVLPRLEHRAVVDHHFGRPDAHGIVGESQACWALRDQIAFVGRRSAHVLVAGESGTGKELISRAIHRLSSRGGKRLVSRNAATIPDTLIDAELFGNLPNYPNPGTPERRGLIGEAEGSSLFFDEIGELPLSAQAHLLRVLDAGGEYHRLGESRARISDIRLIAATNREPDRLKEDLLARLTLRVHSPSLNERREDVPLLAAMLLGQIAASDPDACSPFCEGGSDTRIPRFRSELMFALVEHDYTAHVRELESLLWIALASSRGDALALTAEVKHALSGKRSPVTAARKITRDELLRALEQHDWVRERVWKALGLSNRFVLNRLLKKHRILPGVEENGRDE